ncbi:MAG: cation:proton antiporter [Nitrospiraceae bacterium]|nr:cation:proton antiporter [Nitrospiraceae bacterium]
MTSIELQISLVLLFALIGYLLASRINQSAIVGIIIIGIIIGPSVFSFVDYTDAVKMLAHLGAIILLFAIGLEFKIKEIYKLKYLFIALAGVIFPWIAGYILGYMFGYGFKEAMFIGIALTATSIAITAGVLKEMNKLNTSVAKAIIGAAVVDDALGLIALSVAVQFVKGEDFAFIKIFIISVEAIAFLIAGILAAPYLKKLFLRLDKMKFSKEHTHFLFIAAIMFCFFCASIAQIIGLSAIVGAFLAGAVLEGIKFKNSKDLKEGAEYLHVIFGAIFFISLGILTNMKELTFNMLPFFLTLLLIAVLTKVFGCGAAAWIAGFKKHESLFIGFGMSPRGEVAMIVALIGLTSNIINQDIYVSIVLMSVITTIITPFVIRQIKRDA